MIKMCRGGFHGTFFAGLTFHTYENSADFRVVAAQPAGGIDLNVRFRPFFVNLLCQRFGERLILNMADAELTTVITGMFQLLKQFRNGFPISPALGNGGNGAFAAGGCQNANTQYPYSGGNELADPTVDCQIVEGLKHKE